MTCFLPFANAIWQSHLSNYYYTIHHNHVYLWLLLSVSTVVLSTNQCLSLTYKVLTTTQPGYLRNLISVDSPHIETRSSSSVTLSRPSSSSFLKITDRSFRYVSPWSLCPGREKIRWSGSGKVAERWAGVTERGVSGERKFRPLPLRSHAMMRPTRISSNCYWYVMLPLEHS